MQKSYIIIRLIFFSLLIPLLGIGSSEARDAKGRFIVVIDPGHGGKDSGAVGRKSKEKDIVLAVALQTGEKIKALNPNIVVHYTRSTDHFIGLNERANFANKRKADLFVSIHANSIKKNSTPNGAETYVLGLHRTQDNLEVAMKENAAILYEEDHSVKYEDFDPNSDESYIIFQFIQNKHLDASIELANTIQTGLVRTGLYNRGVKQAGFLVLRAAAMPSVLIELGFISNPSDENFMNSAKGKDQLSRQIAQAVVKYEEGLSKRSGRSTAPTTQENSDLETNTNSASSQSNDSTIYYRIQVSSFKNKVPTNHSSFKGYKEHVRFYKEGNYYKYTIYNTPDLEEAKKYQQELRKKFKDCFIVSFNSAGEKVGSYH